MGVDGRSIFLTFLLKTMSEITVKGAYGDRILQISPVPHKSQVYFHFSLLGMMSLLPNNSHHA